MKKIILICLINFFYLLGSAQTKLPVHQCIFHGKIAGQQDGYVFLHYTNEENKLVKDSCALQNGRFSFKVNITEPTLATLKGDVKSIADNDSNSVEFWIDPGKMSAILEYNHFKAIKINGSKTQRDNEILKQWLTPVIEKSDYFENDYIKTNYEYAIAKKNQKQEKLDSLGKRLDIIREQLKPSSKEIGKIEKRFISTHPDSYVSAFELVLYKSSWPLDTVRLLYNRFNPDIQTSRYGKEIEETISEIDNNLPGKPATNFATTDIKGQPISLSNFKGKYVLLDFWASWCVPCRESTPHLKELFKKYHNQGLEIIGISEDDKPNDWKEAVAKDGVNIWYNILSWTKNDKADNSTWISTKFGVQVLPTKSLIDKNGIIIGRYEGTEGDSVLDKKLTEIFKH